MTDISLLDILNDAVKLKDEYIFDSVWTANSIIYLFRKIDIEDFKSPALMFIQRLGSKIRIYNGRQTIIEIADPKLYDVIRKELSDYID